VYARTPNYTDSYALSVVNVTTGLTVAQTIWTPTINVWQRIELPFLSTTASSYLLMVLQVAAGAFIGYVDGGQLESVANATLRATTYIDGDQPGCQWDGARQASLSTRSSQWRGGGKIVDLESYGLIVTAHNGVGSGSYTNVNTDNGIIGGATFQRSIVQPRAFSVSVRFTSTSSTNLHTNRQSLLDALKPNLVSPQQPISLRYTGSGKPRIIHCHYEAGLDDGPTYRASTGNELRFIAYDPYFYAEYSESKWFSAYDQIPDADYVLERAANGTWHALAGGVNGLVTEAVYSPDGTLYVAGAYTTAYNAAGVGSPVTVNSIAKWDGTSWTALGAGFNAAVHALALTPDGTLYAGGDFTNAAYPRLAKWNGTAWSAVGSAAAGTGPVYALAYDAGTGELYIAGNFLNWNGIADADGIVRWYGSAYAALGTGLAGGTIGSALAIEASHDVIVGGAFTSAGGVAVNNIARWRHSLSAWHSLGAPFYLNVDAVAVDRAGIIYAGGRWTSAPAYIAKYSGAAWSALGAGVNGTVYAINSIGDGRLVVGGQFTSAGGLSIRDTSAIWNGSAWESLLVDLPGSAGVQTVAHNPYTNELALGYNTGGTAIASNTTDVTITNPGTEDAAPMIFINHTGTLEAIINWTTGKALYFDLTVQLGETLWLDLSVLTPQYLPTFAPTFNRNGPRLWSIFRGDITRYILPNSDLASFRLLPGDNTILVKTRNAPAGASFNILFRPRYLSSDA